ncbi:MAG: DNA polymerase III subunit beta [Desulfobacterales bacterium]|nr:DNA polymerase III subunit beta [Desulfobacterales bacterium]
MEFKIRKKNILRGLTKIQGITGKKTNIPITCNVIISAKKSCVSILATDLQIAFQGDYESEVMDEGSAAVPSRKLYEIIREFPSDLIVVKDLENKWIQILDNKVQYNIVGMETGDFPSMPNIDGVELFELNADVFRNMIEKTIYAVVDDEGRAHLAGVYFETISEGDEKKMRMVSTDGHRLSKIDQIIEKKNRNDLTIEAGVIVPKSGMVEILRLLEGGNKVFIGFKDKNLIVKKDNEVLTIRLIDGEFPDYNLVIPNKTQSELRVDRQLFLMMLKRMSILCSDKYRGVRLKIDKEQMESKSINPEIGESREVVPVNFNGNKLEVAFNPRYLTEALNTMNSHEVIIGFNDEINPCVVEGGSDPGFLGVVMPMRI